mgnify:CR=1 FL=1
MGIQGIQLAYKAPMLAVNVAPYYGMSTQAVATEEMILGLTGRGTEGTYVCTFELDAPEGLFQYFCYPVLYGACQMLDTDSGFVGGWDGANDDYWNIYGPIILDVHVNGVPIPFYVYRTDHESLGLCHWVTQAVD